ncbi:glycosyltransferase family 9 protein [Proteus penneri]|uniref:glycosyltransferase family 9 protein n=1 Tax=Proteus penneri TaxID=102862 RepID=UPI000E07C607|nr:glycosyltransferase family 9 protein [Proteus penneri]SUB98652.1 lipopolysaccharide core biosynthesis glycosyl transferase [Proteus penneri]
MKLKKLKWVHNFLNIYNPLFGKMKKTDTFSSDIQFNSILIFSTTALGDFMFNTPAIRAIRAHYPDAHITLVSSKKNRLLVENYDQIDSVVYWDNKIKNLLPIALQAKKYKPELAIILHSHLPYDVLFAVMAGCQYILRNTFHVIPEWFQKWIIADYEITPHHTHLIQSKLNLIHHLGIRNVSSEMEIPCKIPKIPRSDNQIIGFQIGTSTPERKWSTSNFVRLAEKLIENKEAVQIKLIGSPRELELSREFFSLLPVKYHEKIFDLIGKTSLSELLSHINTMDVLVTGDTGPLHLAIALKRATISLFVTANPLSTGPYQDLDLHTVIKKEPLSREIPEKITDVITVDEVFDAVNKTLKD